MELFKPEFGLVFWMFFVFVVLFAILAKYAWPFIIRNIDERAEFIDKGVAYSQEAKMQLDHATENAQALLADAHKQQMEILREAAQMIEQARKESEQQFRNEVSAFALQIAEKLLRKELSNDKTQLEMIDKLLNDIETKN